MDEIADSEDNSSSDTESSRKRITSPPSRSGTEQPSVPLAWLKRPLRNEDFPRFRSSLDLFKGIMNGQFSDRQQECLAKDAAVGPTYQAVMEECKQWKDMPGKFYLCCWKTVCPAEREKHLNCIYATGDASLCHEFKDETERCGVKMSQRMLRSAQQNGRKRRFTNHQRTSITREVYPKPNPSLLFENDDDSADVSPTPSMTAAANDEPCAFAKLWGQLDGVPFHSYMTSLPSTLGRGSTATEGPRKPPGFIDLGRSKALSREHATISWVPAQKNYQITCLSKNGMVVAGNYHAKGGVERLNSRTPIKLGPALMYFLLPESIAVSMPSPVSSTAVSKTAPAAVVNRPKSPSATAVAGVTAKSSATAAAAAAPKSDTPSTVKPEPATAKTTAPTATPMEVENPGAPTAAAAAAASAPAASATTAATSFESMVLGAFRSPTLSATARAGGLSSGDVQNWIMQNYPEWNQEGPKMRTLAVGIESVLSKSFAFAGGDRWTEPSSLEQPNAKRARLSTDSSAAVSPSAATGVAKGLGGGGSGGGGVHANGGAANGGAGVGVEEDAGGIDVGMDD